MNAIRTVACAAVLTLCASAVAAPLKLDRAHSSVSAVFKQMNVPVEAQFQRFSASIDYDPAKPQAAKASVVLDVASIDIGDADIDKQAAGKEWFDAARYPQASFVSSTIQPAAGGALNVRGKLTIKGRSADVAFPLKVSTEGAHQVFEGQLPIRRLAFRVGEGEWQDISVVADEVLIKFRIAAGK